MISNITTTGGAGDILIADLGINFHSIGPSFSPPPPPPPILSAPLFHM